MQKHLTTRTGERRDARTTADGSALAKSSHENAPVNEMGEYVADSPSQAELAICLAV